MHFGLIPRTQPRHLLHERAARPEPEDSGRPVQRARRARRADPRLHRAAGPRRLHGLQRQSRGLHQPRPHRHAAQGPHRLGRPHALSAHRASWACRSPTPTPGRTATTGRRSPCRKFLKEIVEETSRLARTSPHVNQASGVSVRMSIANYENLVSNAERRALALGETGGRRPRQRSGRPGRQLARQDRAQHDRGDGRGGQAVGPHRRGSGQNIFDQHFDPKQFRNIVEYFESGNTLEVGDRVPAARDPQANRRRPRIPQAGRTSRPASSTREIAGTPLRPQLEASVAEFILDGLYCHNRLNKKQKSGTASYGQ